EQLPANVYISFDVDGLDPKLCLLPERRCMAASEVEQALPL
ncbi:MAG: agmatinase, partial [Chitinophagaceae bacterium]|nr:agmatinase [Chitinophagaceae bacterium]